MISLSDETRIAKQTNVGIRLRDIWVSPAFLKANNTRSPHGKYKYRSV
jgi:hypothetical protein